VGRGAAPPPYNLELSLFPSEMKMDSGANRINH